MRPNGERGVPRNWTMDGDNSDQGKRSTVTNKAPTLTIDDLIAMLKQVMEENPSRTTGTVAVESFNAETPLDETGFNSYDLVEIIFKIEDSFGIEIDYNANNGINDVRTIGELREEIVRLLAKEQA